MTTFICLFFPTFMMIELNNNKKTIDYVKEYCLNNLKLNFICLFIVGIIQKFDYRILDKTAFTALFTIKYIFLATIIALIINYVKKHYRITIEIDNGEI